MCVITRALIFVCLSTAFDLLLLPTREYLTRRSSSIFSRRHRHFCLYVSACAPGQLDGRHLSNDNIFKRRNVSFVIIIIIIHVKSPYIIPSSDWTGPPRYLLIALSVKRNYYPLFFSSILAISPNHMIIRVVFLFSCSPLVDIKQRLFVPV